MDHIQNNLTFSRKCRTAFTIYFRPKNCSGLTKVNFALNSSDPKFLAKANPTVAIIRFKSLENELSGIFDDADDVNSKRLVSDYSSLSILNFHRLLC